MTMNPKETLRDIPSLDRYQVSHCARVWDKIKGKWYTGRAINKKGYVKVSLITSHRKRKSFSLHRLVALAHIPNPENKPEVNHNDGDKLNNHKSNLSWATPQENTEHAIKLGLRYPGGNYKVKPLKAKKEESDDEDES